MNKQGLFFQNSPLVLEYITKSLVYVLVYNIPDAYMPTPNKDVKRR